MDVDLLTLAAIYLVIKTVEVHVIVKVARNGKNKRANDEDGGDDVGGIFNLLFHRMLK